MTHCNRLKPALRIEAVSLVGGSYPQANKDSSQKYTYTCIYLTNCCQHIIYWFTFKINVVRVHGMRTNKERRCITPLICNVGVLAASSAGKKPQYILNRRLSEATAGLDAGTRNLNPPARS
jgi:hypothetical protein